VFILRTAGGDRCPILQRKLGRFDAVSVNVPRSSPQSR
jgi:hypothetical protein